MAILYYESDKKTHSFLFEIGSTVREILDCTHLRVHSGCRGNGACGQCLIYIQDGKVSEPTSNELANLSQEQLRLGIRLACQVKPLQDVRINVLNSTPESKLRSISFDEFYVNLSGTSSPCPTGNISSIDNGYGAAVDLGTTNIRLSVWDLNGRVRIASRCGTNNQCLFGSDIVTRLIAAGEAAENAKELSALAKEFIREALFDISIREFINIRKVNNLVIVGNTAMLALLSGKNPHLMLNPENWTKEIDCRLDNKNELCEFLGIAPDSKIEIVQPLTGFVGSDLSAGVLATGMIDKPEISLLIDFGTNSEIAVWDTKRLWVTSTAGGPAFEGYGINCGMQAEAGAIYRFEFDGGKYSHKVINDCEPKGICGSGLIDVIACGIRSGIINNRGRFTPKNGTTGNFVLHEKPLIVLREKDIDSFQRAKSAIATGVKCLTKKAGITLHSIKTIYISGSFGQHLDLENAGQIGLLPGIKTQKAIIGGNTALSGCEILLLSNCSKALLESVKTKAEIINLSNCPEFEDLFLQNLFLQKMEDDDCDQ